jgi:hypothetical protein
VSSAIEWIPMILGFHFVYHSHLELWHSSLWRGLLWKFHASHKTLKQDVILQLSWLVRSQYNGHAVDVVSSSFLPNKNAQKDLVQLFIHLILTPENSSATLQTVQLVSHSSSLTKIQICPHFRMERVESWEQRSWDAGNINLIGRVTLTLTYWRFASYPKTSTSVDEL